MPARLTVQPGLRRRIPAGVERALQRRLRDAVRRLDMTAARVSIELVDDRTMARLHARHMGESGPTDVLSFSAGADEPEGSGDVAIDWDAVVRQAARPDDRARLAEATVLLVHALCHLLGHDHARRAEAAVMLRRERAVLRRLGVADVARPYDPRRVRLAGRPAGAV